METIISEISGDNNKDEEIYDKAAKILKSGGLVAFPTETVYGLGANALDPGASRKVYEAKGRPSDNPLIVHIANISALYDLSIDVNKVALKVAKEFWPGPLTMILRKKDIVPNEITGGLGTVAIRMPSHPTARHLIEKSGLYIAAPSANTSGHPSPTKAEHVMKDLNGKIDMIIKDDTVDIGIESTIVDLTGEIPIILRPGYITKEMLEKVLGKIEVDAGIVEGKESSKAPRAPGMKYKHYAPQADLTIVEGDEDAVIAKINSITKEKISEGYKIGIMSTDESFHRYKQGDVRSVGTRSDESTVAKHLYEVLREFDELEVDYIYSEGFSRENVGQAVMNRLIKAAGHTIIKV